MENWAQRIAEMLSDEDGTATVVRTRGQDVILEWVNADDETHVLRGVCVEGQLDVDWRDEPRAGWPTELR
jgi:hypothetical protein